MCGFTILAGARQVSFSPSRIPSRRWPPSDEAGARWRSNFVLQTNVPALFTFGPWTFAMPLGVAMLFAAIAGALVTAMVFVLGRSVRALEHERDTIQ